MAYILLKEYYFKEKIIYRKLPAKIIPKFASNFYTKKLHAKIMPQKLQILALYLLLQNLCQTKNL
jgi:hypothetical protein